MPLSSGLRSNPLDGQFRGHPRDEAWVTNLSTIPQHQLSITCGLCKHHRLLEVANLIAIVGGDTTAHEVRQRARCNNCGVKGNNTYQIVYRGGSYDALMGAANTKMDVED